MCQRTFSALTDMKIEYRSRLNVESDLPTGLFVPNSPKN